MNEKWVTINGRRVLIKDKNSQSNEKKLVGYVKLGFGPTFRVYEKDGKYFDEQDLPISEEELKTMDFHRDTNIKMNEKIRNSAFKKKDLKLFLRDIGVPQDELYYKTGFHFEDVKTREDFNEVRRLLGQSYYYNENKYR